MSKVRCTSAPAGSPHQTLNHRPRVARHSGGGGDVLLCYLDIMYVRMHVCIYRKTDVPQLYPFPLKGHAARATWAKQFLVAKQYKQGLYLFELATRTFYIFDGRLAGLSEAGH